MFNVGDFEVEINEVICDTVDSLKDEIAYAIENRTQDIINDISYTIEDLPTEANDAVDNVCNGNGLYRDIANLLEKVWSEAQDEVVEEKRELEEEAYNNAKDEGASELWNLLKEYASFSPSHSPLEDALLYGSVESIKSEIDRMKQIKAMTTGDVVQIDDTGERLIFVGIVDGNYAMLRWTGAMVYLNPKTDFFCPTGIHNYDLCNILESLKFANAKKAPKAEVVEPLAELAD